MVYHSSQERAIVEVLWENGRLACIGVWVKRVKRGE
jgi:hypothetical protein